MTTPTARDVEKARDMFRDCERIFAIDPAAATEAVIKCAAELIRDERKALLAEVLPVLEFYSDPSNAVTVERNGWVAPEMWEHVNTDNGDRARALLEKMRGET